MPAFSAIVRSCAASSVPIPLEMTMAERHPMRPATSSAVRMSSWGSAMMARSARLCARSARVPEVWMSKNTRRPVKRCARKASCKALAWECCESSSSCCPAKTATVWGANKGVR